MTCDICKKEITNYQSYTINVDTGKLVHLSCKMAIKK